MMVGLLQINTPLIVSSTLPVDSETRGNQKVLAICQSLEATTYINPIGGIGLYTGKEFKDHGINLFFHNMTVVPYNQAGNNFISHLSIIDVLMYNSPETINEMLNQYKLLEPADIVITANYSNK